MSVPDLASCHAHSLLGAVIEYWTFSLFYCASELWGSVVISVLFWSLANEVCTVDEAKVGAAPTGRQGADPAMRVAGSSMRA